jgi:hypothetical protein
VIQYPWGADLKRVNYLALAVVVLVAFVASSLWYSPLLFGRQFLELSGLPTPAPNAAKALSELLRTFVLAFVIARLVLMLNIADWKGALALGFWLWIGFPVVLLTGSMLWQNVPWKLAAIHSGDWLIKLMLIPVTLAVWRKREHRAV